MKLKRKTISGIVAVVAGAIYLFMNFEVGDPNRTKINDEVYLAHEHGSYSIYCKQMSNGIKRRKHTKLIATSVDSIIISYKYGTLFHGLAPSESTKEWFYIDVSDIKNIHHDFDNLPNAAARTMGTVYMDSIRSAKEVWMEYRQ